MKLLEKLFLLPGKPNLIELLLTVAGVISVRIFLENLSSTHPSGNYTSAYATFIHYPLFFFSILLSLVLFVSAVSKLDLDSTASLAVRFFPIILLPPIADLFITGGSGWRMTYIFDAPQALLSDFIRFFGPLESSGVSPGLRIEAIFIIAAVIGIMRFKKHTLPKAVGAGFLCYILAFLYASLPSLFAIPSIIKNPDLTVLAYLKDTLHGSATAIRTIAPLENPLFSPDTLALEKNFDILMAQFLWLLITAQLFLFLGKYARGVWTAWKSNLRLERIFYYIILGILGILLSLRQDWTQAPSFSNFSDILTFTVFFTMIALNGWLAVIINDFADIAIDRISNPLRPLVSGKIDIPTYKSIGWVLTVLILVGSFLLPYQTAVLILLAQAAYFLYSSGPLRLKRFFPSSSALLGLAALSIVMSGFFLVSPDQRFTAFPSTILWGIFLLFALISNIKDLKDYAGDKADKILTMPTVFGLKTSKLISAVNCTVFAITLPFILEVSGMLIFSLSVSAFSIWILSKKIFYERYLFYAFFIYMLVLLFKL